MFTTAVANERHAVARQRQFGAIFAIACRADSRRLWGMTTTPQLSTTRGAALYIGALLGPSLLLLPGLAAALAGPASILAWLGLLIVSGLLARVFTTLGTYIPAGGVAAYAAAGLGRRAGRATSWCFLAGVVSGAPVVCLIGGSYVEELLGGGRAVSVGAAAVLLTVVLALTLGGARTTTTTQLVLVGVLVTLVAVAVIGALPAARLRNWAPFAPHGVASIGSAAAVLALSFVGWEAIAPLTARLRDPARQLPRVIGIAFTVTALIYLALAGATIAVLGADAGGAMPLAALLRVAVGAAGPAIAAVAAVVLTLAATNAYLSGAAAMVTQLRSQRRHQPARAPRSLQLAIAVVGFAVLGVTASGLISTAQLVAVPTTLFLTVYLACTAAAARIFDGATRAIATMAGLTVLAVLAFSGWALIVAMLVGLGALFARPVTERRSHGGEADPAPLGVPIGRNRALDLRQHGDHGGEFLVRRVAAHAYPRRHVGGTPCRLAATCRDLPTKTA
jgi:amino acid efflux transporter